MELTTGEAKAGVLVFLGIVKLSSGLASFLLTKLLKRLSQRLLNRFIGKIYISQSFPTDNFQKLPNSEQAHEITI